MADCMGRRSFLALLGFAPIAAPAAVAAAGKPALLRRTTASTPYMKGYGRRVFLVDEFDAYPEGELQVLRAQQLLTWPDGPEKEQVRQEWSEFMRNRIAREGARRTALSSATASCPVFIDDVGGGP